MMERAQPEPSFPLFAKLPVELQCRIWELCLPTRVVELDLQGTDMVHPTSCSLRPTSLVNSRPPIATRICPQSRSVAQLAGMKKLYSDSDKDDIPRWSATNTITGQWVIPSTDVLHLHYWPEYDIYYNWFGSPPRVLLWLAREKYHMQLSIVAPLVMGLDEFEGSEYYSGYMKNFELLAEGGGPYLTTLCVINLHVGLDTALRTEGGMLFGRLGEERVKLVGADDEAALRAYYNLWTTGPVEDTEPARFFNVAVHKHHSDWLPQLAHWKQRLVTKWVSHHWSKAAGLHEIGDIPNRGQVWRMLEKNETCTEQETSDPDVDSGFMQPLRGIRDPRFQFVPNELHPWVARILRDMPRFEPVVMFRLCEEKCYMPKPPPV